MILLGEEIDWTETLPYTEGFFWIKYGGEGVPYPILVQGVGDNFYFYGIGQTKRVYEKDIIEGSLFSAEMVKLPRVKTKIPPPPPGPPIRIICEEKKTSSRINEVHGEYSCVSGRTNHVELTPEQIVRLDEMAERWNWLNKLKRWFRR